MRDYRLYLQDIVEAMGAIERFMVGMEFEELIKDDMKSSAIMRKLEIIGEASKGIPWHIRKDHPEIPWKAMAGMRDKLIHFYFGVDYDLLWQTINHRIPQIKPLIIQILQDS